MRYRSLGRQEAFREHLRALYWLARELDIHAPIADSCTAANSIPPVHCWDIRQRVREAGIAKDMPNKSFGRIAELKFGPDKRRLATTDNWWETVLWLTPSIIKS